MEFDLGKKKTKKMKQENDTPLSKEEEEQQKQEEIKRQQEQQKRQQQLSETLACVETAQSTLEMLEMLQASFSKFYQDVIIYIYFFKHLTYCSMRAL